MTLMLEVPAEFLQTHFLPPICLFSGQTDGLFRHRLKLHYLHPSAYLVFMLLQVLLCMAVEGFAIPFLILGPVGLYALTQRRWIEIFATNVFIRYKRTDYLFNFSLVAVPLLLGMVLSFVRVRVLPSSAFHYGIIGGFLCMLVVNILWTAYTRMTRVRLELRPRGRVLLHIPERLQPVYDALLVALNEYLLIQAHADTRPLRDTGAEAWTEQVGPGWDQGRSKSSDR